MEVRGVNREDRKATFKQEVRNMEELRIQIGHRMAYDTRNDTVIIGGHHSEEYFVRAIDHEFLHRVLNLRIGPIACAMLDNIGWYVDLSTIDLELEEIHRVVNDVWKQHEVMKSYVKKFKWKDLSGDDKNENKVE